MAAPGTSGRAVSSAQPSTNHLASGVRTICLATFLTCSCMPLPPAALHRGVIASAHLASGPIRAASECIGVLRKPAMQLGMLSIFGFVDLASGHLRVALECTGVLRKCGMQLGMLWISGFVHLAAGPLRPASECTGVLRKCISGDSLQRST